MSETSIEVETIAPTQAARQRQTPRWLAIIIASLFAALIPETIMTSSTSVVEIVANPVNLVYIAIFYGTAMLFLREVIIRKPAGWGSVVLLSIAFGICNEGVAAGTWYTVDNQGYHFFGPVDVAWAVALTAFHIFISMLMTVAFTDILFPRYAGKSLLGRRGMAVSGSVFVLFTFFVVFAPNFRSERLAALGGALVIAAIALRLPPATNRARSEAPLPGFWRLRIAGFLAYLLYFVDIYFVPAAIARIPQVSPEVAQLADIAFTVGMSAWFLWRGLTWMRRAGWGPRQNVALMAGATVFSGLLSVVVPSQLALLEPVATVGFLAPLVGLGVRWRRREQISA